MSTYQVNFANGTAVLEDPLEQVTPYYSWADFKTAVDSLRYGYDFERPYEYSTDTEFRIIKETNDTFTLKRKNYVDNSFVGYVNVESGLEDILAVIDRIEYIYVNGTPGHQAQIAALSIS